MEDIVNLFRNLSPTPTLALSGKWMVCALLMIFASCKARHHETAQLFGKESEECRAAIKMGRALCLTHLLRERA